MSNLKGKVAVVTGASKGIGAGIAESFAAAGASVVVNYASSREGADRVVRDITSKGGKAIAVQGDVSIAEDVKRLFSETKKAFGAVDVVVNNAGVYEFDALEAVTEKEFHREFNTNVLGTILTIQESLNHFGPEGGSVINISSTASLRLHAEFRRLLGHEGRRRFDHAGFSQRARAEKNSRQHLSAGWHRNRGRQKPRHHRQRLCKADGRTNAARTYGAAR